MKKSLTLFLIYALSVYTLIVTASDIDNDNAQNENEEIEEVQFIDGQAVIYLDETVQKKSGIKTLKLESIHYQPEFIAYGKAINISPLLTIHNQYLSSLSKQTGAKARLVSAEKSISRLRQLHQGAAVSTRKLQNQQSQWQTEKAIYKQIAYKNKIILNNSKIQWGATVTDWLTKPHSQQLDNLLNGESTLLKISLPADKVLPANTSHAYISATGNRNTAYKAEFVSQLPQINNVSQGPQYLFLISHSAIKMGMNFTTWITQENNAQSGVIIPENSLAWHLGQALVFIKIDEEKFVHRNIKQAKKVANGYFISQQLFAGEEVVTTGTQMLLSHEFRSQIPDEDDDD